MRAKGTRGRVRMRIGRVVEFVQERLLVNQPRIRNSSEGEVVASQTSTSLISASEWTVASHGSRSYRARAVFEGVSCRRGA